MVERLERAGPPLATSSLAWPTRGASAADSRCVFTNRNLRPFSDPSTHAQPRLLVITPVCTGTPMSLLNCADFFSVSFGAFLPVRTRITSRMVRRTSYCCVGASMSASCWEMAVRYFRPLALSSAFSVFRKS